uniref:Secreted protein n=1 Tax=Ditylenchus dipsaci TaxID=166011 RepID=A0A915DJ05_9BILA
MSSSCSRVTPRSSCTNKHSSYSRTILAATLVYVCLSVLSTEARHHHHHRKEQMTTTEDYEYKDINDYSSGVFVDSVPIKTTPYSSLKTTPSQHHNTNRFPKLRKFFEAQRQYYYQKRK